MADGPIDIQKVRQLLPPLAAVFERAPPRLVQQEAKHPAPRLSTKDHIDQLHPLAFDHREDEGSDPLNNQVDACHPSSPGKKESGHGPTFLSVYTIAERKRQGKIPLVPFQLSPPSKGVRRQYQEASWLPA